MLDIGLVIDAYGLTHDISGIRNRFGHLIPTVEDLKLIEEAQGRDIKIVYSEGKFDWGELEFSGKKDPNFDFKKFLVWIQENEAEIREKIDQQ